MNIRLILVPYDSGAHRQRLGRGPSHFVENGAVDRLQGLGLNVDQVEIESDEPFLMVLLIQCEFCKLGIGYDTSDPMPIFQNRQIRKPSSS